MQTSTETSTSAQPPARAQGVTVPGTDGAPLKIAIPQSASDMEALILQRNDLTEQLTVVTARRDALAEEVKSAMEGASRTGLEDRIRVLDQRILQLENDIAATGRAMYGAPAELVAGANVHPQQDEQWAEGLVAGGLSVGFFVGLVALYRRYKRRRNPKSPTPVPVEVAEGGTRMDRLERGMEAIAVEIERVSEGQRFVTKLLAESQRPFSGAPQVAEAVPNRGERDVGNL